MMQPNDAGRPNDPAHNRCPLARIGSSVKWNLCAVSPEPDSSNDETIYNQGDDNETPVCLWPVDEKKTQYKTQKEQCRKQPLNFHNSSLEGAIQNGRQEGIQAGLGGGLMLLDLREFGLQGVEVGDDAVLFGEGWIGHFKRK